jgi:hypothetical protein
MTCNPLRYRISFAMILKNPLIVRWTLPQSQLIHVVHVNGVRLCLWTAASNGPVVYPPDDK